MSDVIEKAVDMSLETPVVDEYDVFVANLDVWLNTIPGKYVLIKGSTLAGTYESRFEAERAAKIEFEYESYFVRQVRPLEFIQIATVIKSQ